MDALLPAASMQVAASVPLQPDAPASAKPARLTGVAVALMPDGAAGTDRVPIPVTGMPVGRLRAPALVAHGADDALSVRVQVAASRVSTTSQGGGCTAMPGSAASGDAASAVAFQVTPNATGYVTVAASMEAAPAALTTTTATTG